MVGTKVGVSADKVSAAKSKIQNGTDGITPQGARTEVKGNDQGQPSSGYHEALTTAVESISRAVGALEVEASSIIDSLGVAHGKLEAAENQVKDDINRLLGLVGDPKSSVQTLAHPESNSAPNSVDFR